MYKSFYGMKTNPFTKEESVKYPYKTKDYTETINRFNYLKEIKGIGVFYGESGLGKTYTLRNFIESLNKDLYRVIYISATSELSSFDFLKILAEELNLDVSSCYRSETHQKIQKEIMRIVNQEKMNVVIAIDEAHLLTREILFCLKVLYDFEMDTKDYVSLILIGYPELRDELRKTIHETLKQRIIVNYRFEGLTREETKEYVKSRLELVNANKEIFTEDALNALYGCSKSSPRRLNTLVLNSLMLGAQNKKIKIDSGIVMIAKEEMDLN